MAGRDTRLLSTASAAGEIAGASPPTHGPFVATPVTVAAVARIWERHGLGSVHRVERLAGGQINAAYRVNGQWVLRVRPVGKDGAAFRKERAIFERLRGRVPLPEVVAIEETSREIAAPYLISRWVSGQTLAQAWLLGGSKQREWLLAQLAELLRALHEVRFPACGDLAGGELAAAASWRDYLTARLHRRLAIVRSLPNAPQALLSAIEARTTETASTLDWGAACVVHRDLHFGNVLVEGDRITALLDFEAAVAAPMDYELDQLARFLIQPGVFLPSLSEVQANAFRGVWPRLRSLYPSLFAAPHGEVRLALYAMEYDLAVLRDCLTGVWDDAVTRRIASRLEEATSGRMRLPG